MPEYFCHRCRQKTEHVSLREAARRLGMSRKTLSLWVKNEWVAYQELPSGRVMVCSRCLLIPRGPGAASGGTGESG